MSLFWIGVGLLVVGAAGFLVMFANSDFNTGRTPRWANVVGIAGLVVGAVGVGTIAASAYYAIAGWLG